MVEDFLLRMKSISKRFQNVNALTNMDFDLKSGEVHALLGENGAGKSTLIKILGGIYKMDTGEIIINGEKAHIDSVRDAHKYGISIIHQELVLVPQMTVEENIFLGSESVNKLGFVKKSAMNKKAQELLDDFDVYINASTKIKQLTIAQQQIVEIIKAVSFNAKILIMDEPTSSLSDNEIQQIFAVIMKLRSKGVGIIYISHRMAELNEISDRVTVIRDGLYIGTKVTAKTTNNELVNMMIGRSLKNYYIRTFNVPGDVVMEVKGLTRHGVVEDINFFVRKGEILGFAGLIGAGRSELMKCIFGLNRIDSGEILINNQTVIIKSPNDAMSYGIVLVPESRTEQGLFLIQSAKYNITFKSLDEIIKGVHVNNKLENQIVKEYIQNLSIKTNSFSQKVSHLSGGNQQKISIAKWLCTKPSVLILDEPTRGVDVVAKAEIYSIMDRLASQGIAIIMISSELPEVINMSDRVIVMNKGKISRCIDKGELSQEKIMQYEIGGE
jgi:ribose transport system ATP-binding protein/inositol transport system ATP-binding protein